MIDNLAASRWFRHPWRRRLIAVVLLVLLALLALFPRQYRAAVSLTPTDPASLGLGGALGQLGAFTNVFGSQAAIEISLKIARSVETRRIVIQKLDLRRRLNMSSDIDVDRWLDHQVDVKTLRGGILQVETKLTDANLARTIVGAFALATRDRLAQISQTQTAYKRKVLEELVSSAGDRLDRAQAAYDTFRRSTRYSQPGSSIAAIGARIPILQAQIKGKEIELRSARAFATDDNIRVRQILAETRALRSQLTEAENLNAADPNSVNRVVVQSTQVQRLERELAISLALYDSYKGYLQGTSVEDLTASGQVRILEPPYIDTARQFRTVPAGMFLLVLMTWLAVEFYLLRPPLGSVVYRGHAAP